MGAAGKNRKSRKRKTPSSDASTSDDGETKQRAPKRRRLQRPQDFCINDRYPADQQRSRAVSDILRQHVGGMSTNVVSIVISFLTLSFTEVQWQHTVYLLRIVRSDHNFTYLGSTNDFWRRLRQHRGEISGGAKTTTRKTAGHRFEIQPICCVRGFDTISQARSFEYKCKHVKFSTASFDRPSWKVIHRADGKLIHPQVRKIITVCSLPRWSKKCPVAESVPLTMHWFVNEANAAPEMPKKVGYLPDYVEPAQIPRSHFAGPRAASP